MNLAVSFRPQRVFLPSLFRPLLVHLRHCSVGKRMRKADSFVFPEHFLRRLAQWEQLLKAESLALRERSEQIFVDPLVVVLKGTEHKPIGGDHLRFELIAEDESAFEIQQNSRVSIWPKEMGRQIKESDKIAGIVYAKSNALLEVRLNNDLSSATALRQFTLHEHSEWLLKPNPVNPYQYLVNLLCNPREMQRLPGFDTLLYAYGILRSEKLKKTKRDKKMWNLLAKKFNSSQISAIASAINRSRPFVAIHGPPGTGKTKVIAEIVLQHVKKGKNVLVCAPSHKAVDNAMEACKMNGLDNFVRLGEEADDGALSEYRIGKLAQNHAEYERIEKDIRNSREIKSQRDFLDNDRHIRRFHSLLRKMGKRKNKICESIGKGTSVIFCTCTSGQALRFLLKRWFCPDLVVMDEASQMVECASWIMLLHAPRFVIVGDHQQLPPFLLSARNSPVNSAERLHISLLEYINETFKNEDFYHFLSVQYRSNELIQKWSNKIFYDNKLVTYQKRTDIPVPNNNVRISADLSSGPLSSKQKFLIDGPLVLIDTDKGISDSKWQKVYSLFKLWYPLSFREGQNEHTHSFHNIGEAFCAVLHLHALNLFGGLDLSKIGCITPYSAQAEKIQKLMAMGRDEGPRFEVSSVDAFQGQQREAIVMSLVRNNKMRDIGFLREHRRTNVAITRAKRQFVLIASSRMLNVDRLLRELYGVIRTDGLVVGPDALLPIAHEIWQCHLERKSSTALSVAS
ncbi:hypothetical protein niasHS_003608 [Heterodera schachtii]|uniref:Helicase ATP-binding domain-containing protein n=1 Tax=Heterodera schachtii TaxID=97005 RepID=A0ABD2KHG5_HETSC